MANITFGTPPEAPRGVGRSGIDWQAISDTLLANPGQWARVEDSLSNSAGRTKATQIRKNRARFFEDGTWDVRVEKVGDDGKRVHLWVQCVSPDDALTASEVTIAPTGNDDDVPF